MHSTNNSTAALLLREKIVRRGQKNVFRIVKCTVWTALLLLLYCKFKVPSFLPSGKLQDTYIQVIALGSIDVNVLATSLSIVSAARISAPKSSKVSQEQGHPIVTGQAGFNVCMAKPQDWAAPPRESNGYLWFRANGGLNQMRAAICDMVAIARHVKATLVIPDLDKASFWSDSSGFADLFDLEHFIHSLKSDVHILKQLPRNFDKREVRKLHPMVPVSWSSMAYYKKVLVPLLKQHKVVYIHESDSRLANNSPRVPPELQKLRCRVQYRALRFSPTLRSLSETIIRRLRARGPFLALHLRYEMDMLAFTGCSQGCTSEEERRITKLRYETGRWKNKNLDSARQRSSGKCPMTPEETVLLLQALGFKSSFQIYIAAGETFGGGRRMANLITAFPNTVRKETMLTSEELGPLSTHASQLAALDYMVSLAADVFLPTYTGNMARLVEGHRRVLGNRRSILPDVKSVVRLTDSYQSGNTSWAQFVDGVTRTHLDRMGAPKTRQQVAGNPKAEDAFYQNPVECMCLPPEPPPPRDYIE